ncbi:chloride channel CLIC-like protein 1 isoform 2-T2 [Odontesthes bonariensis]|uniref:chloride channel CLIC-like protein 1 isoform X2 n=1 Tax=Odontesthes bonariensis TaxID=219752 RepID=UPI003F588172
MLLMVLIGSLLLSAVGQQVDNDWLDPYDMLNYDASAKTMRKPTEPTSYTNVATKRREHIMDPSQAELTSCNQKAADLHRQIEEQKKTIAVISQQPTCTPVFKRFLSRLLKEIQRVGVPSDSTDVFYDAKIKLSSQAITEIKSLLEGEDRWRTGALDNAVSQILVDLKHHDYEAWKWHFEDTFGVELDTLLKIGVFFLVLSAIVCTQLWSAVSWLVQLRRLFVVCFVVSIIWNWFYLYKIAFAEHQRNIVKMDSVNEKCTGVRKIDWSDSLKEWVRSTWTLQDDPCKKYYEVLMVNPILLVPPTKAISVTITTFITEPLKHFGQGISEFLRALLKDLPVTLQIPVLLTIVLSILVVAYGSVQAAFQHGIMAPLRRPRRDPPPPELEQPQPQPRPLRIEGYDYLAGGDAPAPAPAPAPQHVPKHRAEDTRLHRNNVQRRRNKVREEPALIAVETLRTVNHQYSEDEMDAERHEESPEAMENPPADSESENQQETEEEVDGASALGATANTTQSAKRNESDSSQSKNKPSKRKEKPPQIEPSGDGAADGAAAGSQPAEGQPPQTDVPDPDASAADRTSSISLRKVETVGVPVQETSPVAGE